MEKHMILYKIKKKIQLHKFNKRKNTHIESIFANLNSQYGVEVRVSGNTIVEDNVKIGDYSYINRNSNVENCDIGKFCSISSGVYICPFEHTLRFRTTHPIAHLNESTRPRVHIGNDVLISLNAIILEGVTIGDGAVIGAGAVVTKDVKPYEIVGGVPAHHIGFRFAQEEIETLIKLKWWDWDIVKIKKNIAYLRDADNLVK